MNRAIAACLSALLAVACSPPPESATRQAADEESRTERIDLEEAGFHENEHELEHELEGDVSAESLAAAPKVGEMAPDFSLPEVDGGAVHLADAAAKTPVVLVFGSFS